MRISMGLGLSRLLKAAAVACLMASAGMAKAAEYLSIGTGGVTGVYYPAGGAVCQQVYIGRKVHGVRCGVEATGGSTFNANAMRTGDMDLAIIQSDTLFHAYGGTDKFAGRGAFKDLRVLFALHDEPVTIVARKDAGIGSLQDLKGKRLNVGNPGSGTITSWQVLSSATGFARKELGLAAEFKSRDQADALCKNKIDAFLFVAGHPNASIRLATDTCPASLLEITHPGIDKLLKEKPYFRRAVIPGGMYEGNPRDVKTYGVGAVLVGTTKIKESVAYEVVKAVFGNFVDFKAAHPALANLKKEEMVREGMVAPFHPGAAKYFREAGFIK